MDDQLKNYNFSDSENNSHLDLQTEQIDQWQMIFDDVYLDEKQKHYDANLNVVGWIDSYTNQPIADVQMLESVKNTVQRILSLKSNRILEIGCGTGLLLSRKLPFFVKEYRLRFSTCNKFCKEKYF